MLFETDIYFNEHGHRSPAIDTFHVESGLLLAAKCSSICLLDFSEHFAGVDDSPNVIRMGLHASCTVNAQ